MYARSCVNCFKYRQQLSRTNDVLDRGLTLMCHSGSRVPREQIASGQTFFVLATIKVYILCSG